MPCSPSKEKAYISEGNQSKSWLVPGIVLPIGFGFHLWEVGFRRSGEFGGSFPKSSTELQVSSRPPTRYPVCKCTVYTHVSLCFSNMDASQTDWLPPLLDIFPSPAECSVRKKAHCSRVTMRIISQTVNLCMRVCVFPAGLQFEECSSHTQWNVSDLDRELGSAVQVPFRHGIPSESTRGWHRPSRQCRRRKWWPRRGRAGGGNRHPSSGFKAKAAPDVKIVSGPKRRAGWRASLPLCPAGTLDIVLCWGWHCDAARRWSPLPPHSWSKPRAQTSRESLRGKADRRRLELSRTGGMSEEVRRTEWCWWMVCLQGSLWPGWKEIGKRRLAILDNDIGYSIVEDNEW